MRSVQQTFCFMAFCSLSLFVFPAFPCSAAGYEPVQAEIPVSCLLENSSGQHYFQIVIEPDADNCPHPDQTVITVPANEGGHFTLTVDEPGTYLYRISEQAGNEELLEYDSTVYLVTLYAEQTDDNTLVCAVSAKTAGSDDKPETIVFRNKSNEETHTTTLQTTGSTTETTVSTTETQTDSTDTSSETTAGTKRTKSPNNVWTGDFTPVRLMFTLTGAAALTALISWRLRTKTRSNDETAENE